MFAERTKVSLALEDVRRVAPAARTLAVVPFHGARSRTLPVRSVEDPVEDRPVSRRAGAFAPALTCDFFGGGGGI
jgi:hypothetical protein